LVIISVISIVVFALDQSTSSLAKIVIVFIPILAGYRSYFDFVQNKISLQRKCGFEKLVIVLLL